MCLVLGIMGELSMVSNQKLPCCVVKGMPLCLSLSAKLGVFVMKSNMGGCEAGYDAY